uniref:PH domain-containing protein n=1 Tax=Strongyloides venezuelensis TaxID=75913 RepID=A0A0K0F5D3_STRVS
MSKYNHKTTSDVDFEDDQELSRLYKEALDSLVNEVNNEKDSHAKFNHSINSRKRKMGSRKSRNKKDDSQEKTNYGGQGSYNHLNKSKTFLLGGGTKKPRRDSSKTTKTPGYLGKPTVPKMPSDLASSVNHYFNTTRRVEQINSSLPRNFVDGTGTFNPENDFETIWNITVNRVEDMEKELKKLRMELTILIDQYHNQLRVEEKYKDNVISEHGIFTRKLSPVNFTPDSLKDSPQLNEAIMMYECNERVVNNMKIKYLEKFIEHKAFVETYKEFRAFFRNLSHYKKDYDNYLIKLQAYYNTMESTQKCFEENCGLNDKIKRKRVRLSTSSSALDEVNVNSSTSYGSSTYSATPSLLCNGKNSIFTDSTSAPLKNPYTHGNENQSRGNILNNCYKPIDDIHFSMDARLSCNSNSNMINSSNCFDKSTSVDNASSINTNDKSKDEVMNDKLFSFVNICSNINSDAIFREECSKKQISLSDSNDVGIVITKVVDNSVSVSSTSSPLPPPPSTDVYINEEYHLQDIVSSESDTISVKEVPSELHLSIDEIDDLLCYFDVYGECMDNKCQNLHQTHKKLLIECISYCSSSPALHDAIINEKNKSGDTLAYYIFSVLRKNGYNYEVTIRKLDEFVGK